MVEQGVRRGHVVLVATSADASWTALPVWPCYVPLVQEMLAWCVGRESQRRNVEVGRSAGRLGVGSGSRRPLVAATPRRAEPATAAGGRGRLRRLDLRRHHAERHLHGHARPAGLPQPELRRERRHPPERPRAVEPGGPQERRLAGDSILVSDHLAEPRCPGASPIARPGQLHVSLLYAVLGLLFAETFLAWRFGHHAS